MRRAEVKDAVARAQAYADAVRRGRVVAVQLADPGMLDGANPPESPVPMVRTVAAETDDGATSLVLEPAQILVRAEVDARFEAD